MIDAANRPNMPLNVETIYEDKDVLVVAKPSGMATHPYGLTPSRSRREVTALVAARRLARARVHPVHRLDRATSGLLVFARNVESARALGASLAAGAWEKHYLAIARGHFSSLLDVGEFCAPLAAEDDTVPREALTHYQVLAHAEAPWPAGPFPTSRYSLLALSPRTGRTHQLRLHLRGASYPIVGDTRYGDSAHNRAFRAHLGVARLCLHAGNLAFPHPMTGLVLKFSVPTPPDLAAAMALFPPLDQSLSLR